MTLDEFKTKYGTKGVSTVVRMFTNQMIADLPPNHKYREVGDFIREMMLDLESVLEDSK